MFHVGQSVITTDQPRQALGEIRPWNDAPQGQYLVRDALSWKQRIVHEDNLRDAPFYPAWKDMTPLERATRYPGVCCECRKVIPYSAIRCDEHQFAYLAAIARAA